jgi:hypothetical protein
MSGSLELARVDSIETSIRTAADASMNQLESKPMELTLGLERTINEWHTLTVCHESKHTFMRIRKDS